MSKGIRFKVMKRDGAETMATSKGGIRIPTGLKKPQYYYHRIHGNNEIVQPSEGIDDVRKVFAVIEADWYDVAVAQGHPELIRPSGLPALTRKQAIARFVGLRPVPYTKDSLKPIPK